MSITEFQGADGATRANFNTKIQQANAHITDYPSHITQLTCTKTGTVYALTGLTATAGAVSCMFKVDAAFAAGNTVTVNGTAYTVQTSSGVSLASGAFAAGATVPVILDVTNHKINIAASDAKTLGTYKESDFEHVYRGVTADCNTSLTQGEYLISASTVNGPIPGMYGKLIVKVSDGGTHNNTSNWIWQWAVDTLDDNTCYTRQKQNSGAWTVWTKPNANKADYASGSAALSTAALRNAIIIQKTDTIPTGLADGTIVMKYTP